MDSRKFATPGTRAPAARTGNPAWLCRTIAEMASAAGGALVYFGRPAPVAATLRYRIKDPSRCFNDRTGCGPVIYCIWHNRLALSLILYFGVTVAVRAGAAAWRGW